MLEETMERKQKEAEIRAEVENALTLLSLPVMVVSVRLGRQGLTGTQICIKIKRSEARGEGPEFIAP